MDNLQEPLISNRDTDDGDDVNDSSMTITGGSRTGDKSSPGLFMWLLTFSAGISGLLFGCTALSYPFQTYHTRRYVHRS